MLDYNKFDKDFLKLYFVIERLNYIDLLQFKEKGKIFLAYLKGVEHAIKFVKDTEYLHKNTPQN